MIELEQLVEARIHHGAYLEDPLYRRECHLEMLGLIHRRAMVHLLIVHDADHGCCAIEPWAETLKGYLAALDMDGAQLVNARAGLAIDTDVDALREAFIKNPAEQEN